MRAWVRSAESILNALNELERQELKKRLGATSLAIDDLIAALLDADHIQAGIRRLTPDGLSALEQWMRDRGFWRDVPKRSRLERGITELINLGWVFESAYGPHQRYFIMPWEMAAHILPLVWSIPWPRISTERPTMDGAVTQEDQPAPIWMPFWQDIFAILSYARKEPLLLTTQGEVYRRQKTRLEKLLSVRDSLPPSMSMVDYYLAWLYRESLLVTLDNPYRFVVSESACQTLFQGEASRLFHWQAEVLFDPSRTYWPSLLWVSLAQLLPPDRVLNRKEVLAWLASIGLQVPDGPYGVGQIVSELTLMDWWEPFPGGLGRLSPWATAALNRRFEPLSPRQSLVQPTGEILVPPDVLPRERWQIDALATRVRLDRVSTYRLDQEAVKAGMRRGLTADQHRLELESLSRTALPDNVRINLDDWYRAASRHRVMEVTIVHSARPEDSRDVETVLGPNALGRLSPTDVIIPANRVKEVLKRIEKSGVPVLAEVLKPSLSDDDEPSERPIDEINGWQVHLAHPPTETAKGSPDVRRLLTQSQRESTRILLTYQVPGESRVRTDEVIPISIEPRWIQVLLVRERRYVLIEWPQILDGQSLPAK